VGVDHGGIGVVLWVNARRQATWRRPPSAFLSHKWRNPTRPRAARHRRFHHHGSDRRRQLIGRLERRHPESRFKHTQRNGSAPRRSGKMTARHSVRKVARRNACRSINRRPPCRAIAPRKQCGGRACPRQRDATRCPATTLMPTPTRHPKASPPTPSPIGCPRKVKRLACFGPQILKNTSPRIPTSRSNVDEKVLPARIGRMTPPTPAPIIGPDHRRM